MPLDPRLLVVMRDMAAELLGRNELLTVERLDRIYAGFRARFGPEVLAGLDGQALLLKMHGRGDARDSLAYWLEFKNDDEFPTTRLGGIGGGSALKYIIYRRAETGQWMTGTATRQVAISDEEAAVIAGKQRDELLAGARLLDAARRDPAAVDHVALQAALEAAAPSLHHLGWVHKYFSLLAPEVLDDFHQTSYQRYHLVKLRLRPLGDGLYINGGLFAAAARELGLPMNQFSEVLNRLFKFPRKVWKLGTSSERHQQDDWPRMRDGEYVAIGHELGDLREHLEAPDLRERLRHLYQEAVPDAEQAVRTRAATQVARFLRDMALGDTVVAVSGLTVRGVGEVIGDYQYRDGVDFPHTRAVRWRSLDAWTLPANEKPRQAIAEMTDVDNLLAIEHHLADGPVSTPAAVPAPAVVEPLPAFVQRIADLLEHKPQVILHGPPGTGKSHWAEYAVRELAARSWYGRRFAALAEPERQSLVGPGGAIEMCTFHPGFGYEDFVEGLRPTAVGGQLAFELRDGLFKRLCQRAQARPERRFFLVIDEINRGDLPRIFGELFTLLEADKRGWPITLALGQERFVVPPNVAIVATMNTADRSIALLDAALRRRFAFHELMPDPAALGDSVVLGLPLGPLLTWINEGLLRALGPGMRQLQVGHAYLMHNRQPIADPLRLATALRNDILPLLEEYCHDQRHHLRSILGGGLFRGTSLELDPLLFEPAQRDQLAGALHEHFADRLRSPEIVDLLARAERSEDDP